MIAIATFVLAAATLLLAGFTGWMARSTKQVVEQNKHLIVLEDRHHTDNLRPYCVLEVVDLQKRGWESVFFASEDISSGNGQDHFVMLNCRIVNKGLGPAFNIRIGMETPNEPQHVVGFRHGILGAGESFSIKQSGYQVKEMIPFFTDNMAEPFQRNVKPGVGLYVEYDDMFGKSWRSRHIEMALGFLRMEFT